MFTQGLYLVVTTASLMHQPELTTTGKNPAILRAILLATLVALTSFAFAAPAVTEFPVVESALTQKLVALGNLSANQSINITPQIEGRIVDLHLPQGARVPAGKLLVRLDDREQAAITAQARIDLGEAKRQLAYMEKLISKKAISVEEIQAQRARVDRLGAALQAEQAQLDQYILQAPFAGTLSFHDQSVGALINAGTVLTTLDDLDTMKLTFKLPESSLSHVARGATITATSDAWPGTTFTGTIDSINPRIDPLSLTFQVRAMLANPDGRLLPGMLMRTEIELPPQKQLVVPARSIMFDSNQRYVYVIDQQNKVARRLVTTGQTNGEYIVVLSGLSAGERVVNEGVVKVSEGRQVQIVSPSPATEPALPSSPLASRGTF